MTSEECKFLQACTVKYIKNIVVKAKNVCMFQMDSVHESAFRSYLK